MTLDGCLELVRREARGEALSADEQLAVEAFIAEHAECCGEVAFERELAAVCCETCAVEDAPAGFVGAIMSQLPADHVFVHAPTRINLWGWLGGAVAAGATSSAIAWQMRDVWIGWLSRIGGAGTVPGGEFDWYTFFSSVMYHAPDLTAPSMVFAGVAAVVAFVWGAISLAEDPA